MKTNNNKKEIAIIVISNFPIKIFDNKAGVAVGTREPWVVATIDRSGEFRVPLVLGDTQHSVHSLQKASHRRTGPGLIIPLIWVPPGNSTRQCAPG